jgi:hypothetical protein
LLGIFFFTSQDILFMSIHVVLLNLYCAYYVMDDENYGWRLEERNDVHSYVGDASGLGYMLKGFDMTGISAMVGGTQSTRKRERGLYDWLQ